MSCNGCDPIGVGLVKDKSYQVSFLPSGTPSDAEYAGNENVKYAESNDIIIMQDTGDIYQCVVDKNHKKSWTLMYENVPQVSYIESGSPTDEANAAFENVTSAKENSIIINSDGIQYQLIKGDDGVLSWVIKYTPNSSGSITSGSVLNYIVTGTPTDTVNSTLDFIINAKEGDVVCAQDTGNEWQYTNGDWVLKISVVDLEIPTEAYPYATIETVTNTSFKTALSIINSLPVEQIMHRGGVTSVIENNLYNDKLSYQANQFISFEGDIQPCATDGKYFRWHNNTTDYHLDQNIEILTSTYDQLKALHFTGLANTAFADTTLNTLDEWCEWIKTVGRPFYPEVKRYRTMDDVVGMVNVVKSYGISHLCTWQSGEYAVLQKIRGTDPECGVGYLNFGEDNNIDSSISKMVTLGNGSLLWSKDLINQDTSVVEKCAANGVGLATWTITDNQDFKSMIDLGVRRIMTNYLMNGGN